jgi:hypothetical protein
MSVTVNPVFMNNHKGSLCIHQLCHIWQVCVSQTQLCAHAGEWVCMRACMHVCAISGKCACLKPTRVRAVCVCVCVSFSPDTM